VAAISGTNYRTGTPSDPKINIRDPAELFRSGVAGKWMLEFCGIPGYRSARIKRRAFFLAICWDANLSLK